MFDKSTEDRRLSDSSIYVYPDTAGYPVWEPCVSHQLVRGREEREEAGARGIYLYT